MAELPWRSGRLLGLSTASGARPPWAIRIRARAAVQEHWRNRHATRPVQAIETPRRGERYPPLEWARSVPGDEMRRDQRGFRSRSLWSDWLVCAAGQAGLTEGAIHTGKGKRLVAEAKCCLYNNCISTSKTCRLSNHPDCRSAAAVAAASTLFAHLETTRAIFEDCLWSSRTRKQARDAREAQHTSAFFNGLVPCIGIRFSNGSMIYTSTCPCAAKTNEPGPEGCCERRVD